MGLFLDERLPTEINYGGSYNENHAVSIVTTSGGSEYRSLRHPFVVLSLDITFAREETFVRDKILSLYARANGMFRGFRVKDHKDFTTNKAVKPPTASDMPMIKINDDAYQMVRWYGDPTDPMCARRIIRKPVAGTIKVGIGGTVYPAPYWNVDLTRGVITIAVAKTANVTGITNAQQAVVTVPGHNLDTGNSVAFTDVSGMSQINGQRGLITNITSDTITVAINTLGFAPYSTGGKVQTRPLPTERITCGCEFDIPCRFNADLGTEFSTYGILSASSIAIIELLNP